MTSNGFYFVISCCNDFCSFYCLWQTDFSITRFCRCFEPSIIRVHLSSITIFELMISYLFYRWSFLSVFSQLFANFSSSIVGVISNEHATKPGRNFWCPELCRQNKPSAAIAVFLSCCDRLRVFLDAWPLEIALLFILAMLLFLCHWLELLLYSVYLLKT